MTFESRRRVSRAFVLLIVLAGSPVPAYGADAALSRVLMLPLTDRTTVVAELTGRVPRVQEIGANPATVTIEAGPIDAATRPLDLTPIARSRFVAHVSVRTATVVATLVAVGFAAVPISVAAGWLPTPPGNERGISPSPTASR